MLLPLLMLMDLAGSEQIDVTIYPSGLFLRTENEPPCYRIPDWPPYHRTEDKPPTYRAMHYDH